MAVAVLDVVVMNPDVGDADGVESMAMLPMGPFVALGEPPADVHTTEDPDESVVADGVFEEVYQSEEEEEDGAFPSEDEEEEGGGIPRVGPTWSS